MKEEHEFADIPRRILNMIAVTMENELNIESEVVLHGDTKNPTIKSEIGNIIYFSNSNSFRIFLKQNGYLGKTHMTVKGSPQTLLSKVRRIAEYNAKATVEHAGYFMSDGVVYLKDMLTAFSTIEEAGEELGLEEDQLLGKTVIVDAENQLHYDDWSDAMECRTSRAIQEDGSGAWFVIDTSDEQYKSFHECGKKNHLI